MTEEEKRQQKLKNLKPFSSDDAESKERARECGRLGGIMAGKKKTEERLRKMETQKELDIGINYWEKKAIQRAKRLGNDNMVEDIKNIGILYANLKDIIDNSETPPAIRLKAISIVMDRYFGKVIQKNEIINPSSIPININVKPVTPTGDLLKEKEKYDVIMNQNIVSSDFVTKDDSTEEF